MTVQRRTGSLRRHDVPRFFPTPLSFCFFLFLMFYTLLPIRQYMFYLMRICQHSNNITTLLHCLTFPKADGHKSMVVIMMNTPHSFLLFTLSNVLFLLSLS